MAAPASSAVRWDERIARARLLADTHAAAADLLTFYAALAGHQKSLATRWATVVDAQSSSRPFVDCVDADLVLDAVPELLRWLQRHAPSSVVEVATELRQHDRLAWRVVLGTYLSDLAK